MNKAFLSLLFLTGLSGCSVMKATPWDWLDHPAQQRWVEITVDGYDREICFSVPDRLKGGGQHTQSRPSLTNDETSQTINIPFEALHELTEIALFNWDSWWGGFLKESGVDFWMVVRVKYYPDEADLTKLSVEQRKNKRLAYWSEFYSNPLIKSNHGREYFFNNYQVEAHRSENSLVWVSENHPTVQSEYITYMVPISKKHEVHFGFFVNEKRYNWQDDPEWNQRRWDMVHKILDTVSISPMP
ncbi:MAG: hypothetical protein V2I48_05445 [Xanthomonadales bacterium]|nr:hypothetical protein [Xanthomonadales bacterium]